jgi:sugar/nucleoside kinase (ribokinase family)
LGQNDRPFIAVDSRAYIGRFQQVSLKPNRREAMLAVGQPVELEEAIEPADIEAAGRRLFEQCGKAVFVTLGANGALVITAEGMRHIPGINVTGPVDIVGAGDSMMAGLMAALCSGAAPTEAAWVGNSPEQSRVQNQTVGATSNF